eukprot:scaffold3440_cov135-Isochrysis_galbana.AAC.5
MCSTNSDVAAGRLGPNPQHCGNRLVDTAWSVETHRSLARRIRATAEAGCGRLPRNRLVIEYALGAAAERAPETIGRHRGGVGRDTFGRNTSDCNVVRRPRGRP